MAETGPDRSRALSQGRSETATRDIAGDRRTVTLKITWRRTVIAGETKPEDFIAEGEKGRTIRAHLPTPYRPMVLRISGTRS